MTDISHSSRFLILLFILPCIYTCKHLPSKDAKAHYQLYQKIDVPDLFLQKSNDLQFGGDIRIGDLQNNGRLDLLVYRAANSVDGGAVQPCFIGAFTMEGEVLWQKGSGGGQPNRPGPVAIFDIDGDGENEIICLFVSDVSSAEPHSMANVEILILNGGDGSVERSARPDVLMEAQGEGPNWVHQRILIANLSGHTRPRDFIIKLGKTIYAFDSELQLLWSYFNPNDQYQNCPAYIPAIGDVDNDGMDEINGGYYLLDQDGSEMWERKLGRNMDCVLIDHWDSDTIRRAICSGYGFVMDHHGDTVLSLGEEVVPHGQELRVADFDPSYEGREMMIRYNGHTPDIRMINQDGKVLREFKINESPNNTGLETIFWDGPKKPALLYNGGALWDGEGALYCRFEELQNPPKGEKRQGWYHCIPADIVGDKGEELVLYNPWGSNIYIFTANRIHWNIEKPFELTNRQYNPRLMD